MHPRLKIPVLQISGTRGNSVTAFNRQTTPVGRVVQVRLPGGSFIWHRPVEVEVRQGDKTYRLPIHDTTLRATSTIALIGLTTILVPLVIQKTLFRRRRAS